MSFEATGAAWRYIRKTSMSTTERCVLLALADRENVKTGQLNPSIGTLCADSGLSDRAVRRALDALCLRGVLIRQRGGGVVSSSYTLCLTFTPDTRSPLPPDRQSPEGCTTDRGGVTHVHPNLERTEKEPGAPKLSLVPNEDPASIEAAHRLFNTLKLKRAGAV